MVVHRGRHLGQLGAGQHIADGKPGPAELGAERLVSGIDGIRPSLPRVPVLDLAGRPVGGHELQPVPAGSCTGLLGGDDLDGVTSGEVRLQGDEATAHLGTHAGVPDVGVDGVGEVHGRGTDGQGDHLSVRGEDVDLVQLEVGLEVGHERAGILGLGLPLHDASQPRHLVRWRLGLVVPVGRHPVLGPDVHLDRTDLELHLLALRAHDRRVQRLVEVELGHGHVVLEPALNRLPAGVDRAQGGIAVPDAVHDHTHPDQVVDLVEGPPLHDHLLVDAPELLRTAGHLAGDAQLGETGLHLADQLRQVEVALRRTVLDHLVDLAVPLRMQRCQGQVLQLVLDLLHAQAVGQRGVDVDGLLGHPLLLVLRKGGQGAHVVEAVGQLDDQDTEVLGERHQHLAHAGRLLLLPGVEVEPIQFGHPVDDEADVRPEVPLQVFEADRRVLHGVVEQGGRDRDVVQPLAGNDGGHRHRMVDVRLARLPGLSDVGSQGHRIRPFYEGRVGTRVPTSELGEQRRGLCDGRPGSATPGEDPGHRRHGTLLDRPRSSRWPTPAAWPIGPTSSMWSTRLIGPTTPIQPAPPTWGTAASFARLPHPPTVAGHGSSPECQQPVSASSSCGAAAAHHRRWAGQSSVGASPAHRSGS